MKKYTALAVFSFLFSSFNYSQQYKFAFGIKGDWSNLNSDLAELSVKGFLNQNAAIEANFGAGQRYVWLDCIFHYNQALKNDFDWYFGGGADFGYWNTNYDKRYDNATHTGFWVGTSGVLGLEYTVKQFPINFALDLGPTIRYIPELDFGVKVGFAMRYAIR